MSTTTLPEGNSRGFGNRRRWAAFVAVAALAVIATACGTTPTPPADQHGLPTLRPYLRESSIDLSWDLTEHAVQGGYEIQVSSGGSPWSTVERTNGTSTTFTDVVPGATYGFRIGAAVDGGPTAKWGSTINVKFYELFLPVIRIDTQGAAPILDKENYVPATMTLDPNGSAYPAYSGTLGIRGRGNSTWLEPKKPYRLRLDTKSPLMGIASDRNFVLLANSLDHSQLRTFAASQLAEATDLAWTPTYRHVEVVLNGQYDGVYQLSEHIRPGAHRVDIDELGPDDNAGEAVTGGYLMEVDGRLEENNEPGFRTARNYPIVVKEPDPTTPEQAAYIQDHVQTFEDRLFGPDYTDPVAGYRPYLDVGAFIDHYLVQEITNNLDGFQYSTFFSKSRGDDQLRFGPIWDFDQSMGSARSWRPLNPTGWHHQASSLWTQRLLSDATLRAELDTRWDELQPTFAQLPAQLDTLGQELAPAIANDAHRWNYAMVNADTPAFVSGWLSTRLSWIDARLGAD
ncbi:MAG: CotH kinase family protein [Actinomycetota bacterium]|nr:CotH kinase family protein [Actinomycetota bacterium]